MFERDHTMPISDYLKHLREKVGNDLLQVPCVTAIVRSNGKILLMQRADNGRWSMPGGSIDPGEHPAQAVAREVWEETGLRVRPVRVLAVVGAIRHTYPNGDKVDVVTTVFSCEVLGGELRCRDAEATQLRYFAPSDMPELMTRYPQEVFESQQRDTHFEWRDEWLAGES